LRVTSVYPIHFPICSFKLLKIRKKKVVEQLTNDLNLGSQSFPPSVCAASTNDGTNRNCRQNRSCIFAISVRHANSGFI
jgi:hypothetical protein